MRPAIPWCQNQTKTPLKEWQANILHEHGYKNSQQNTSKSNPTVHWKNHKPQSSEIYSWAATVVQYSQIKVIHHINERNDKNHMILSIDTEIAFHTAKDPFLIKNPQQGRGKGNISQYHKGIIWKNHS